MKEESLISTTANESLTGVIERITFHSQENGYTVARMKVKGFNDVVTVVGSFANIQAGQTLQLEGIWAEHPKHGQQFKVSKYKETKPATLTGIEKYLGSGLIKGVGPVTAKRIVAHFGLETLDIIENKLDRLEEVPGIGKKRINMIKQAWADQKVIKDVMIFLQSHGVSTTYAVKIFKLYGKSAIAIVSNNPFQLATDVYGIGFKTADLIAQKLGVSPWSKTRYKAGLLYVLTQSAEDGHCFLPKPELIDATRTLLSNSEHEAETEAVFGVIEEMVNTNELIVEVAEGEMNLYFKPTFYHTEQSISKTIKQHISASTEVDLNRVKSWIERYTKKKEIQLSPEQKKAVEMAASQKIMIITGGPGCGKTFTTKTIVALWKAMDKKIGLAAPTGRAAQRLGEMAGLEASTIHRLLEFDPKTLGFKKNSDNPLPFDALIVDESSMLDLFLANSLLKAIAPTCQLLIVGDVDQLPSVGPGKVLKDLIDSGVIPTIKLTQVFRQAAASKIITSAHQINQGIFPQLEPISNKPQSDCLWHTGGIQPEHGVQTISELVSDFLPSQGFNCLNDVQVLSPMTRGLLGTRNLNQMLQNLLNSPSSNKPEVKVAGNTFRVGDRIIQLKNDYDRGVFNGDLGIIQDINFIDKSVSIEVNGALVNYDFADLNEINLAWAISIHKSQGSEYPVVIIPIYMQHYVMLTRNLIYTAITRAKKLVIIVGSSKAISIAVNQYHQKERYTRIKERLCTLGVV